MSKVKLHLFFAVLLLCTNLLSQNVSIETYQICHDKELWSVLKSNEADLLRIQQETPRDARIYPILSDLALSEQDTLRAVTFLEAQAVYTKDLDAASKALGMTQKSHDPALLEKGRDITSKLLEIYKDPADTLYIHFISWDTDEEQFSKYVLNLDHYSPEIERDFCKEDIDNVAVEKNDSLRINLIDGFIRQYPHSKWINTALYYRLSSMVGNKNYDDAVDTILSMRNEDPEMSYLTTSLLLDPDVRKNYHGGNANRELLLLVNNAIESLKKVKIDTTIKISYEDIDHKEWQNRLEFLGAKEIYYNILANLNLYGNEDSLYFLIPKETKEWKQGWKSLNTVKFTDNDSGRQAELAFWKGKYNLLINESNVSESAAYQFADCLCLGSPRNRFDKASIKYLEILKRKYHVNKSIQDWCRSLKMYTGPVFQDVTSEYGLDSLNYSRVAFGDFNEDNYPDILFNGCRLYQNMGGMLYQNVTEKAGLSRYNGNGGLFADFNQDGLLDFVMISGSDNENGDKLFKNMGGGRFANVNERAGDINDKSPTEGAAWIDRNHTGYPSLYFANYEKWQVQDGYPDYYWDNKKGYFNDASVELGIRTPAYTHDYGQAGRGVSPADFDNDGDTEIFVSNYRLDRDFLWDWQNGRYVDIAAQDGLAGVNKKGYYGHTIGADWGDYDNDGDLDIFIANLAHPRYIDISDKSMLMRNDGVKSITVGDQIVTYTQFTNVTREAGIHYDELHSDPNWFDVDNDGDLDLFVTSIYENERSYLYLNNGDGTFTDVTWLAGCRGYNSWGNATADIDRDGKLDLCVASTSGVHLFHNITVNGNSSVEFRPTWENNKVRLIKMQTAKPTNNRVAVIGNPSITNSPAFGTRIRISGSMNTGKPLTWIRELNGGKGTTSQNEEVLHIGLGKANFMRDDIVRYTSDVNRTLKSKNKD